MMMTFTEQHEDMFQPAELHPDLLNCRKMGKTFEMLHHPLVVMVPYHDQMAYMANRTLEAKREMLKEAEDKKDWFNWIYIHERPYRLEAFLLKEDEIKKDPQDYWDLLRFVYTDSESPGINKKWFKMLLDAPVPQREHFMDEEDRDLFNKLPDVLEIYRGYQEEKAKHGLSFTLDLEKAKWFAQRWKRKGKVVKSTVKKKDVVGYTNSRSEQEIIITRRLKLEEIWSA
jgi:hypothetical protein